MGETEEVRKPRVEIDVGKDGWYTIFVDDRCVGWFYAPNDSEPTVTLFSKHFNSISINCK